MGQLQLSGSILLIATFSIILIAFAISFAENNSTTVNIINDSEVASFYSSAQSNVSGLKSDYSTSYSSIVNTTIQEGSDSPKSMGSFTVNDKSNVQIAEGTLRLAYKKIFGSDESFGFVLAAFLGFFLLTVALYVYKTIRGNPD